MNDESNNIVLKVPAPVVYTPQEVARNILKAFGNTTEEQKGVGVTFGNRYFVLLCNEI